MQDKLFVYSKVENGVWKAQMKGSQNLDEKQQT